MSTLQGRRQGPPQAWRDARQAGCRRAISPARRRHGWAQIQTHPRHGPINDAIEYYGIFQKAQARKQKANPRFRPAQHRRGFLPPADVTPDVRQIQEDLPQEQGRQQARTPRQRRRPSKNIIARYNERFGTNHRIEEFDLYYQDVQQRHQEQQFPNADLPKSHEKLDITIVVDMLLTGFDSKYPQHALHQQDLKHHGLIQAFSRTNRVLNDSKPYGHILDFRGQQKEVDAAIAPLFRREADQSARNLARRTRPPSSSTSSRSRGAGSTRS